MTFKYKEYEDLVKDIKSAVDSLLEEKGLKTKEEGILKDNARYMRVQGLKTKWPDRHKQTQYLLTLIETLEKSSQSEQDKKIIINGAAYYIYFQIDDGYKNGTVTYYLPNLLKPSATRSEFHNALHCALDLGAGEPNEKQRFEMYSNLLKFVKSEVYHPEGLLKGLKPDHPFSEDKVIGYNVVEDLKTLSNLVQELENIITKKAGKEKNPVTSTFFNNNASVIDDYSKAKSDLEFKDDEDLLFDTSEEKSEETEEEQEASRSASI